MGHESTKGLTLLELVVAMALFAMVAVMGLQSLTGMMKSRDRLAETAATSDAVSTTLTLLRRDLASAVPALFYPPDGATQSALQLTSDGGFTISTGGQPRLDGEEPLGLSRILWRLDTNGALTRQSWPLLAPARAADAGPQIDMLNEVTSVTIRIYVSGQGWQALEQRAPTVGADSTLPAAIEVLITTRALGTLRTVVTL